MKKIFLILIYSASFLLIVLSVLRSTSQENLNQLEFTRAAEAVLVIKVAKPPFLVKLEAPALFVAGQTVQQITLRNRV